MYRITYWNTDTHTQIKEYFLTKKKALDKIKFFINNSDVYEIAFIDTLVWNWDIFKKCWKNYKEELDRKEMM